MELEDLKAAWLRERAEYPCSAEPRTIMIDTRQKAMKMDREFNRRLTVQIVCGLLFLGLIAAGYRHDDPLPAKAGLAVMLLALAIMTAGAVILKFRLRVSHPELPREQYLAEQRSKIEARISLLRRNIRWLLIPAMSGLVIWQSGSVRIAAAVLGIAAPVSAAAVWWCRRRIQQELLPALHEIEREIEYLTDQRVS